MNKWEYYASKKFLIFFCSHTPPNEQVQQQKPALVSCLERIDSGQKSPQISKKETYEMKLLETETKLETLTCNKPSPVPENKENRITNINKHEPSTKYSIPNIISNHQQQPQKTIPNKELFKASDSSTSLQTKHSSYSTTVTSSSSSSSSFPSSHEAERCRSCNTEYSKGKFGQHRKVFESCKHAICFSCLVKERPCVTCQNFERNELEQDTVINDTIVDEKDMEEETAELDKNNSTKECEVINYSPNSQEYPHCSATNNMVYSPKNGDPNYIMTNQEYSNTHANNRINSFFFVYPYIHTKRDGSVSRVWALYRLFCGINFL